VTQVLVVLAALANAGALVLLRRASEREPAAPTFGLRQLWTLLHRPIWAAGMAAITLGFGLQATALSIGAVSHVQLIIILELPLTPDPGLDRARRRTPYQGMDGHRDDDRAGGL